MRGGLRDLSISRTSFKWGIPVPGASGPCDVCLAGRAEQLRHRLRLSRRDAPRWHFWPADLHLVGKDILRFHAVYWPAFLMAAGLPPPRRIFVAWLVDGRGREDEQVARQRRSSRASWSPAFGLDPVRYFLLREMPFGGDGDFSRRALITRINVELANDLGNLAQRSLSLIARNCDGRLPGRGACHRGRRGAAGGGGGAPGGWCASGWTARRSTRRWRRSGR